MLPPEKQSASHEDRLVRAKPIDPVLTLAEAAQALRCHPCTIRRQIDAGKLSAVRLSKRRVGIRRSMIEDYLRRNTFGGGERVNGAR
jgi:excisionase family DNA binding protein